MKADPFGSDIESSKRFYVYDAERNGRPIGPAVAHFASFDEAKSLAMSRFDRRRVILQNRRQVWP